MLNKITAKFRSAQTNFTFGSTSAIITNLGLIFGLHSQVNAKLSIIGGILVIALADNIADSFGIHIFQEAEKVEKKAVWVSTVLNFISRLIVSLSFALIVVLLPMGTAIICATIWGLLLLSVISYLVAKEESANYFLSIFNHLLTAIVVIILSNLVGDYLLSRFR